MLGDDGIEALHATDVAIFGLGGVGSWCAESLVRSGIGRITLVDSDTICVTNINRQLQATTKNLGRSKVMEMASRLRDIHPKATIEPIHGVYEASRREEFHLEKFDYVIDAIDSLSHKVDLIMAAHGAGATVYSSMGAGNKMDPSQIRIGSIWASKNCSLAKLVRKKLRERGFTGDCQCVYSLESAQEIRHTSARDGSHKCICADEVRGDDCGDLVAKDWCDSKQEINASVSHIAATFGQFLAGMVVNDVMKKLRA
jgi:tRNA A37 threonylcarbamoyladenosine dehydratase